MARGGTTRYDVIITAKVKNDAGAGAAQTNSTVDKMLRQQLNAIEQANRAQAASAKRTAVEIAQVEAQQAKREIASRQAAAKEFQRVEAEKVRLARQSEREIARINAQTARQAEQQMRIQERAAKALANEKERIIKREQEAFRRAEKEKQDAIRKTQAAQKASADATSAAWVTAFGLIKTVAVAAFAAIVAAGTGLGFAISRAMSFDMLERSLKVVAGSAEEAQRQMARLITMARLPGLGVRQAIEASIALQVGFQTALKDTGKRLELTEAVIEQFSNAIALTGGGPEIFQRVITQLVQMSNAGKVLMTDLRPIIQAAPAIGQSLVKAFGTISPEEINALGLSTEEFMKRWVAALSTLERAPETAANAWTNFTTAFDLALVKIGKPFLEPLTKALTFLEPLLDRFGTRVGEIFTMIGQDAAKLWAGLPEMTRAQFADMLSSVESIGGGIVKWFQTNYPLMQAAVSNVLQQIANFWKTHGEGIKATVATYMKTWGDIIRSGLAFLSGDFETALKQWPKIVENSQTALKNAVILLVRVVWSAILLQKDLMKSAGRAIADSLIDGFKEALSERTKRLAWYAVATFAPIIPAIKNLFQSKSPSQVFYRIGEGLVVGLMIGMLSQQAAAIATAQKIATDIVSVTEAAILNFGDPSKPITNKKQATAQALKTEREQIQKIREELEHQVSVLREIAGEQTAVERVNALLANPNVAKRINERTQALLRFNAALEDNRKAERQRFVNAQTRPRRAGEEPDLLPGDTERSRRVGEPLNSVDLDIADAYSQIIAGLNDRIFTNTELTQVQITQQRLEMQGLFDLNDARTQEALRIASVIDQMEALASTREQVRRIAEDVSSVFSRAVENWSGSLGDFFKDIGRGFSDLLRRMVADLVQSKLSNVFEQIFSKIFGGSGSRSGGGGFGGGSGGFGGIFGVGGATPPFAGGGSTGGLGSILSGVFGMGGSSPASLTAGLPGGGWGEMGRRLGFPNAGGMARTSMLGGLGSTLGAMAPLLGVSLGASLGGQSRFGQVLGGIGGGIAGLGIAALLGSGTAGSILGAIGMSASFLPLFPIAAALIVGAIILKKQAQRRKDEKTRNQATIDTRSALWQILAAVQTDQMDGNSARSEIQKLHQNWIEVGNSLKDSKTRRHHMETWNHFQPIIDLIEKEIGLQTTRSNNRNRMVPVFASGGVSATSQLIKVTPGEGVKYPGSNLVSTVPGRDRGYDSEYMFAAKGTRIIPKSEMKNSRGYASGGVVGESGSMLAPNIAIEINIDKDGIAHAVITSPSFKPAVIRNVKVGRAEKKL